MIELVLAVLAGALLLDIVLEVWRMMEGVERRRRLERDRIEMLDALDRTGRR
jgi:hypothetical protein